MKVKVLQKGEYHMKRIIGALFCLCCITLNVSGKKLSNDSLKLVRNNIEVVEVTDKLDDYLKIIQHFKPVYIDSLVRYVNKLEEYAQLDTASNNVAHLIFEKAYLLHRQNKLKEGHQKFLEAEKLFTKLKDTINMARCYKRLAVDHFYLTEYDKTVEYSMRALKIYEDKKMLGEISTVYSFLDNAYKRLWQYDLALKYANKNLKLATQLNDSSKIGMAYISLASIKLNQEKGDEAEKYYLKALDYYHDHHPEDRPHIASIHINLGIVYSDVQGKHKKAIKVIKRGLEFHKKTNNINGQIYALFDISGVENKLKNYARADEYMNEAYALAEENDYSSAMLTILSMKSSNYSERKDYKRAFNSLGEYVALKDSLMTLDKSRIATELQEKYESEKKEQEIVLLKSEKKLQELKVRQHKVGVIGLVILAFALLVILLFVFLRNRERKRMNAILASKNEHIERHNLKISEMNRQYRLLNEELTVSEEKLKEMNASKDKFFSIIAHDLKNPFHTVLGFSFLLQQTVLELSKEEVKGYSEDIYRATNQVSRLLENLLDWASSQTGRMEYKPTTIDLFDIVADVKNAIEPVAEKKNIDVNWDISPDTMLIADNNMLQAVIRNLMSNAVKFTEEKGSVQIWSEEKGEKVSVFVKDNGIGMSEEEVGKVFKIDSKFRREGTNEETGSGLGLLVCNEFIKKHQGTLHVTSKEGEGSVFEFEIQKA